jgi:hypothetical protein
MKVLSARPVDIARVPWKIPIHLCNSLSVATNSQDNVQLEQDPWDSRVKTSFRPVTLSKTFIGSMEPFRLIWSEKSVELKESLRCGGGPFKRPLVEKEAASSDFSLLIQAILIQIEIYWLEQKVLHACNGPDCNANIGFSTFVSNRTVLFIHVCI